MNRQVSSKHERKGEKSAVISIYSKRDEKIHKSTIEVNKNKLSEMTAVLMSAADFLDANLQ